MFQYVELGRRWSAGVYSTGAKIPSTAQARGPIAGGDTIQIPVTLGLDHAVAVFRAVDALGVPLTNTKLAIDCQSQSIFSDQRIVASTKVLSSPLTGTATIKRDLKNGRNESGEIVLHLKKPLVRGLAVDTVPPESKPLGGRRAFACGAPSYASPKWRFFWLWGHVGMGSSFTCTKLAVKAGQVAPKRIGNRPASRTSPRRLHFRVILSISAFMPRGTVQLNWQT